MAFKRVCIDSERKFGDVSGDKGAKGLSDVRRRPSAVIIAWGRVGFRSASSTDACEVGVPLTIVRPGCERSKPDGLRMRAVTVWPLERAARMVSLPLRPDAPVMKRCIVCAVGVSEMRDGGGCDGNNLNLMLCAASYLVD